MIVFRHDLHFSLFVEIRQHTLNGAAVETVLNHIEWETVFLKNSRHTVVKADLLGAQRQDVLHDGQRVLNICFGKRPDVAADRPVGRYEQFRFQILHLFRVSK